MTDARYPERWLHDRRVTRLSDRAHRAYVVTLAYAVANRTDGVFVHADFADLPAYVAQEVEALLEAGLWELLEDGTGFRAVDYPDTQSSRAELDAADGARVAAREKKARQRAQAKAAPPDPEPVPTTAAPGTVPGDVPGDHTGQARTGQARTGSGTRATTKQDEDTWPPVAVPGLRALPDPRTTTDCHGCGWEHGHGAGCRYAS